MSSSDWYRRTTWSDADRSEFNSRLKRCRSAPSKAQNLRIQAFHLAEVGLHAGAIELLDRMFAEFPERIQLSIGHLQKADSLTKLGQIDAALDEYRATLQAERDFPYSKTDAWLDFGWLVVDRQLRELYDEASRILDEFREEGGIKLPATEYRYNAVKAILAAERGDLPAARQSARQALSEAGRRHSGLRYHPTLGLVDSIPPAIESQLKTLAGI